MSDAVLAGQKPPVRADPAFSFILSGADRDLNRTLAPVYSLMPGFPGDAGDDPARGLYHPVAGCARDLAPGGGDAFPGPNGLGDLCADALRATANGLLADGDADRTPFTAAAVATGELRGALEAGAAITFADLFGILPLGLSPDPAQSGLAGEPLVSGYVDEAGLRALCAMQLLAQAGLALPEAYLNLSGLAYGLKPAEADRFYSTACAATALGLTRLRAREGSAPAARALAALAALPCDQGAALLAAAAAGNPYASAMVPAGQLAALGRVARAAEHDAAVGSSTLDGLLMAQAEAAVGPLRIFAPADAACTGPAMALGGGRRRIVLDRYLLLMIDAAKARFGVRAAVYQGAQGDRRLDGSPDGLAAILASRISLKPGAPFQEVKSWMALLLYLATPPARGGHFAGGWITSEYGSIPGFSRFQASGAAVRNRNASYPQTPISALAALAEGLRKAP